jgi:hypothetical protein
VEPPADARVSEKNTVSIFRDRDGYSIYISVERCGLSTTPHGVRTQKTNIKSLQNIQSIEVFWIVKPCDPLGAYRR